ncbi:MAG TPA: DUF115 domain-containing protein [Candidatus Mucispirillum faecigallinarum]|uniref:DUF115 domain-containing protein n=1 Tax=Candidatus Mucispirillum faecigallinarum TaxID=2838699 RepID=A0A9D2GRR7_9BACT|nr:DUF115 domain-containing protein [Candidatus Mucispirillum faecigallinarum]
MPYKKNIEALAKRNPRLAQIVDSTKLTGRYVVAPSQRKDRLPSIVDVKYNKNFYNNIDPYRVAEQDIKSRKLNVPDLAVFLGFGLSYEVHEYIRNCPSARILIIERDPELLKTTFSTINCTDLINSANIYFAGCEDIRMSYPVIFNFFNITANMYYLKAINVVEQPLSFAVNKDYYLNSLKMVKEAINQVLLLYGNDPYDSLLGIKYTLRNIPIIIDYPGIADLKDVFKGKPGIVVASGPSLNKNIKLLDGLREKAVICAADGSVKILKHHGLAPAHLVTSLERVIQTSYLFEGLTEEDVKDSYLAACPVVVPETYANFPGEKIIVYRNFATFEWLDIKKGILDIGPSAGNMAFKVLEYLGCDPIIMIGQDLSVTDDLVTHAEGFHSGGDKISINDIIEIEGNYQEKVKTRPFYKQFLLHYERDIATYKGTAINATEGGAKIHGTEIMTFQEAIDKYIKDDIDTTATIKKHLKHIKYKEKEKQIKETLKKLYHAKNVCDKVTAICSEGLEKCAVVEEILRRTDVNPKDDDLTTYKKNMQLIGEIPQRFATKDFYLILMHYVQSIYIKVLQDINSIKYKQDDGPERDVLLLLKYKELYSVLISLIKKFVDELNVSIEIMEKFKVEFAARKEDNKKEN